MNVFELIEATKDMSVEEKNEFLDRYYKRDRLLMSATLEAIYRDQDERRD